MFSQTPSLSVSRSLSLMLSLKTQLPVLLLGLWAASPVRLHMGSRESERGEWGNDDDKVTGSKSYSAFTVNIMSAVVVRLVIA